MSIYPQRDQRTIDSVFDVWLSRDMLFNNPGKGIKFYRKYTKAKKVKYTKKILLKLDRREEKSGLGINVDGLTPEERGRAVAIKLDGIVRYVWRCEVMTHREYDEKNTEQKEKLKMFRKKSGRSMGNYRIQAGGDRTILATEDNDN